MRHIKMFVSSSLKHDKARLIIRKAVEKFNGSGADTEFSLYIHELNGHYGNVLGVDTQSFIDAESDEHSVFLLYAADMVGDMTVREYERAVNSVDFNIKFVYVLHCIDDRLENPAAGAVSWDEFYSKYMLPHKHYEYQVKMDGLADAVHTICSQLESMVLTPLSAADMNYERMIDSHQKEYRQHTVRYMPRGHVDTKLAEAFNPDIPGHVLTLVTGASLSGKTRSVVNALAETDPKRVKIHYLRGFDVNAPKLLHEINYEKQFFKGWMHILFIDELTRLLSLVGDTFVSGVDETVKKFFDLCGFASSNPDRLRIVGTTAEHSDSVKNTLRSVATNEKWINGINDVAVGNIKKSDAVNMVRMLRALNLIDTDNLQKLRDGMPIGALFIDLNALKNEYESLTSGIDFASAKRAWVFDAVKSLWQWAKKSLTDPNLLLEYLNNAYEVKNEFTKEELRQILIEARRFFTIIPQGFLGYEYYADEIVVDSVIRFHAGKTEAAGLEEAIVRNINFIITHKADNKYERLTKFANRIGERPEGVAVADRVLDKIQEKLGLERIISDTEIEHTHGGGEHDWADSLYACFVSRAVRNGSFADGVNLMRRRPVHSVKAALVKSAQTEKDLSDARSILLDEKGNPLPDVASTTDTYLINELFRLMDFDASLRFYEAIDVGRIVANSQLISVSNPDYTEMKMRGMLAAYTSTVVEKAVSYEQFDSVIKALERKNRRRIDAGRTPLYSSDAELYFDMIQRLSWKKLSENITSHHLMRIFQRINAVEVPERGHFSADSHALLKTEVLNHLLKPMGLDQAMKAWRDMADIRDSFTLVEMLGKAVDFAQAMGFVDAFRSQGVGEHVTIGLNAANALLRTIKTTSNIRECVPVFRLAGALSDDADTDSAVDSYKKVYAVKDEYTQGILASMDNKILGYEEKLSILKSGRDENKPRSVKTLGHVVYAAPGFKTVRDILFGPCPDFITPEEQAEMKMSPLLLSWLVRKAKDDNRKELDRLLLKIEQEAREEGTLDQLFEVSEDDGANIVNEYIGNNFLTPDYDSALKVIEDFQKRAGLPYITNLYTKSRLAAKYLAGDYDKAAKIDYINEMVLEFRNARRKQVKRAIRQRYAMGSKLKEHSPEPDSKELFPYVDNGWKWSIREMSRFDFVMNMIVHRFVDEAVIVNMANVLVQRIKKGIFSDTKRLRLLLGAARDNRQFINHESMVKLRQWLRGIDFEFDVLELTKDYSIIKDLSFRLRNQENVAVDKIMKELNDYELRTKSKVHRPSSFYDAVVFALSQRKDITISKGIDELKSIGYDTSAIEAKVASMRRGDTSESMSERDFKWITLVSFATGPDEFESLLRMVEGEAGSIVLRVASRYSRMRPSSTAEAVALLAPLLKYVKAHGHGDMEFNPYVIISKDWGFGLSDIMKIRKESDLDFDAGGFYSALHKVRALNDYQLLEKEYHGALESRHVEILLKRINRIDTGRFMNEIFRYVYNDDFVSRAAAVCVPGSKLYDMCEKNYYSYINSKETVYKDFAEFCRRIYSPAK